MTCTYVVLWSSTKDYTAKVGIKHQYMYSNQSTNQPNTLKLIFVAYLAGSIKEYEQRLIGF